LFARQLAEHGQRLYPQHEGLSKLVFVLAPPRLVRANLPAEPSTRANVEWMQSHAAEYRGQWVALRDGVFVAAAPTARQLRALLPTIAGLFLTRVI
jgi:hypothetical protein